MKSLIYLIAFFLNSASSDAPAECDMASFYSELGCVEIPPITNTTKCPQAYTCTDLHPDAKMCYYKGANYTNGAMIPQSRINNGCTQACVCRTQVSPTFECAAVDCVEVYDDDKQRDCINTYELRACCSTGNVCGKDAIAKLNTCEVDGKTYREGESFEPANTRKQCICTADWNGSYEDSSACMDIDCAIEIHYQAEIMNNCAPVFSSNLKSCPIGFQCATNETKIIPRGPREVDEKCTFGTITLNVGDEVSIDDKCVKCTCEVPPFVSCLRQSPC